MQRYIIKSFKVMEGQNNALGRIYTKDERSGNYVAIAQGALPSATKSLMDFMCLSNSSIHSVLRQHDGAITEEWFTIGDRLTSTELVNCIISLFRIELGKVKVLTNRGDTLDLENTFKYVEPVIEQRRSVGRPRKVNNEVLDSELQTIQNSIEASFANTGPIRLTKTLRKRKETLEEFLYKFFTDWNRSDGETPKTTVFVNTGAEQTSCARRRSLGDLYMICKYYYPDINIKDILTILYIKLPIKITRGFRTSKCNTIHKRVWYYNSDQNNTVADKTSNDEFSKPYRFYISKLGITNNDDNDTF